MIGSNWRFVARRAWSFRLMALAVLLTAAEVLLSIAPGLVPVPPLIFASLSGVVTVAAMVARVSVQKGFSDE